MTRDEAIDRARKLRALARGAAGTPEGDAAQAAYDRHLAAHGLREREAREPDEAMPDDEFAELRAAFGREFLRRAAERSDQYGAVARIARDLIFGGS